MAIPAFQKPDKWTSRPLDPKCKTLTDYDPTVEDQIRCKMPAWSGDFRELVPELIAQGVRFDELARLTVHDIGQFVIRAVQGGSLRCGPIGTATHTIVSHPLSSVPPIDDSEHARIARGLSSKARHVLWYMRENNARNSADSLTRQSIADDLHLNIDIVQEVGKELRRTPTKLLEGKNGCAGGWWLSPNGDRVAECCAPPVHHVTAPIPLRANRG